LGNPRLGENGVTPGGSDEAVVPERGRMGGCVGVGVLHEPPNGQGPPGREGRSGGTFPGESGGEKSPFAEGKE